MPTGVQKGRGAISNRTGRFEALAVEAVDDGWGITDEPLPPLATTVQPEPAHSVLTVEQDAERAAVARERLAGLDNVELLEGDAYELLRGRGPFGLVFADGGVYDWEAIMRLLAPGGVLVKDDLTPGSPIDGDPVREFLLRDPRLAAAEIMTAPTAAAIVAIRR